MWVVFHSYYICSLDKDECDGVNECSRASTVCVNKDPGYSCECKDGYRRVNNFVCESKTHYYDYHTGFRLKRVRLE